MFLKNGSEGKRNVIIKLLVPYADHDELLLSKSLAVKPGN